MATLIIKNGWVFDPTNEIDGEKTDIFIEDGKIVEHVDETKAQVIDAAGKVVFPGGVEVHSHIAGGKVNAGRLFRPEDHYQDPVAKTRVCRSGTGFTVPSTYITAYRYAQMGYTTAMEPAMPPMKARHTHEEFMDMPLLDKGAMPLFGNNWFVLEYIKQGDIDKLTGYVSWLLKSTRGYAVKIVNPGGVENWAWGKNCESLDDTVDFFEVTPREILDSLAKANEKLGLPHTIHVHGNNLGHPGNAGLSLETFKALESVQPAKGRDATMHYTHTQFNSYGGEDMVRWSDFCSRADDVAKYINKHKHITIDAGQVVFPGVATTTMTGDGPWEFALHHLTGTTVWGAKPGLKWMNGQVEGECGSGLVPYEFRPKNMVNSIQWAIGLELMLLVDDPWRVFMTTDHPNAGPFTYYPQIISWLMSNKLRQQWLDEKISKYTRDRTVLGNIDREYTLYELCTMTRAGPARALGLPEKGHLGVGADGDVSIYAISVEDREPAHIQKAFGNAAYTIKGGRIVVKDGEVVLAPPGRTLWTDAETALKEDLYQAVVKDIKEAWYQRYTINYENYPVSEHYTPHQRVLTPST